MHNWIWSQEATHWH